MSDDYRGPYTPPSEPPLAFDPRRPVRGSGPVPLTLIVSAVVLVVLVGAVVFIYRGGIRGANDAPAPVGAPLHDIKAPPPPEAGSTDPATGLTIYKTDANGSPIASGAAANTAAPLPAPVFAPPPEKPQPRIVAQPAATSAPVGAPPVQGARPPIASAGLVAPPAHADAHSAQSQALASAEDIMSDRPAPAPHAATTHPAALTKPATTPKPVAEAAAKPATPPAGAGWVQIGAFSSAALADKGWHDIARLAPETMAGKGKKVETVAKGDATLYRTYITGFGSRAAAVGFCDKLKAAGKSCIVK